MNKLNKQTPKDALRAYCIECLGMKQFNADQVMNCQGNQAVNGPCPFFPYRLGKRPTVKVFRTFCIDCTCGDQNAVRECPTEDCQCYPYRFGRNPAKRGQGASAEQMKRVRQSVKLAPESIAPTYHVCGQNHGRTPPVAEISTNDIGSGKTGQKQEIGGRGGGRVA